MEPTSDAKVNESIQNLEATVRSLRNISPGTEVYFQGHKFTQYPGSAIGSERVVKYLTGDSVAFHVDEFQQAKKEIENEVKILHKFIDEHRNSEDYEKLSETGKLFFLLDDLKTEYREILEDNYGLENYRKLLAGEIQEQWDGVTFLANKIVSEDDIREWQTAFEKGELSEDSIQNEESLAKKRIMAKILLVGTEAKAGILTDIIKAIDKLRMIGIDINSLESRLAKCEEDIEDKRNAVERNNEVLESLDERLKSAEGREAEQLKATHKKFVLKDQNLHAEIQELTQYRDHFQNLLDTAGGLF